MMIDTPQVGQGDLSRLLACLEADTSAERPAAGPAAKRRERRRSRRRRVTPKRIAWAVLALLLLGLAGSAAVLWHKGYRVYVIHTGSMSPTFVPGDVVVDRPAQKQYRPGEVITYRHDGNAENVVTHRIHDVSTNGLIHTKGDANDSVDAWPVQADQVTGSVMFGVKGAGYLLVFLQQPTGIGALATGVIGILLLWRLFFPPEPPAASQRARGRHAKQGPAHARSAVPRPA